MATWRFEREQSGDVSGKSLTVQAERYFDARGYAELALQSDTLNWSRCVDDTTCDVQLRWVGSDYDESGARYQEYRKLLPHLGPGVWSAWKDVSEYVP